MRKNEKKIEEKGRNIEEHERRRRIILEEYQATNADLMLPAIDEKKQFQDFQTNIFPGSLPVPPLKIGRNDPKRQAGSSSNHHGFQGFNSLFNPETAPWGTPATFQGSKVLRPTYERFFGWWVGEVVWETSNKQKYTELGLIFFQCESSMMSIRIPNEMSGCLKKLSKGLWW